MGMDKCNGLPKCSGGRIRAESQEMGGTGQEHGMSSSSDGMGRESMQNHETRKERDSSPGDSGKDVIVMYSDAPRKAVW